MKQKDNGFLMIHSSQMKCLFTLAIISFSLIVASVCTPVIAQDKENPPADETVTEKENSDESDKAKKPEVVVKKNIVPEIMTMHKELMTKLELGSLHKIINAANYKLILRTGQKNKNANDIRKKWAQWRIYSLSLKSNKKQLKTLCDQIKKEVISAGAALPRDDRPSFRQDCCDYLLTYAEDLLDGNFYVRLNLSILLSHLDVEKKTRTTPDIPYAKSGILLAKILSTTDQPVAIKLSAAKGLERICYYGDPKPNIKFTIADALIKELKDPENLTTHVQYQLALISALGSVDQIYDLNREATILQTLTAVLVDANRPWLARSMAAKAIGRSRKDNKVNIKLLCYEIVNMTYEMSEAFNKDTSARYWNWCFFNSYLGYKINTDEEIITRRLGILNQTGTNEYVGASYRQLLKLVSHVEVFTSIASQPFPASTLEGVSTWLKENKPTDRSIVPGSAPIVRVNRKPIPDQKTANSIAAEKTVITK